MRLSENVYMLESAKGSYAYLIKGEECMLIDTGMPFRRNGIIKEIEMIGVPFQDIRHILITHHDFDHIGNLYVLQQMTGAQVWASREDIPYIRGELDRHSFKKYLKYVFKTKIPDTISPYVPEETINGVEVIPTPGHTPGHVCLLYDGILFAGDLLENKNGTLRPYPRAWNWNQEMMQESAKKAAGLPVRMVCPAHGEPVSVDPAKNSGSQLR